MAADKPRSGGDELAVFHRLTEALGDLHARVAPRFSRPEVRERARRYLADLLGRVEGNNRLADDRTEGRELGPQETQRLLNAARF